MCARLWVTDCPCSGKCAFSMTRIDNTCVSYQVRCLLSLQTRIADEYMFPANLGESFLSQFRSSTQPYVLFYDNFKREEQCERRGCAASRYQ